VEHAVRYDGLADTDAILAELALPPSSRAG
jgi:hypothetical protein